MDLFGGLTIDLSFWQWFFNLPTLPMAQVLFVMGGWLLLAFFFLRNMAEWWAEYRQKTRFVNKWEWVLLAVDIPALFIQTPKAVEQIFAHLSGAQMGINVFEKFWKGKKQKFFSFEIISIEGYIQFLIRTEKEFRDLVEAAVYAQYTEAEITEVEDYVGNIPAKYPNDEYDIMGAEFMMAQKASYPIRTYPSFEYNISKDAVFSDPMASILENFTRIGPGENFWMQLIVEPTGGQWKEEGIEMVKKMMGQKVEKKKTLGDSLTEIPMAVAQEFINILHWSFDPAEAKKEKGKDEMNINKLSPGTKSTIEAIEEKISKIGFKSKLRVLYAARKNIYNPARCIDGFVGSMNQFHMQDRNALVPYMITLAKYDRKSVKTYRMRNTFTKAFKTRKDRWKKSRSYILNIEELATVWHFPLPFVKAPLVQKAGPKRGEPPVGLPVEEYENPLRKKINQSPTAPPEPELPEELPYG